MNQYKAFFVDSPEGRSFVESLHALIDAEHQKAENEPVLSAAHTQTAKGIRQVISKINTLCTDMSSHKSTRRQTVASARARD